MICNDDMFARSMFETHLLNLVSQNGAQLIGSCPEVLEKHQHRPGPASNAVAVVLMSDRETTISKDLKSRMECAGE